MRRLEPARLLLASHNKGKLRELGELMAPLGIETLSAAELGLAEPEETEADFAGNARLKARAAARTAGIAALADDSGFSLAGLGGAPGVVSARWAGPEKDFGMAMRRAHDALGDNPERRAWFSCAICVAWPDGEAATFLGRVEGHVAWPPRGSRGFGYDPMFVPLGGVRTFGELEAAEKHAISHRARAMEQFVASLQAA
jgi:XTP/dITP diphosphohydrolase